MWQAGPLPPGRWEDAVVAAWGPAWPDGCREWSCSVRPRPWVCVFRCMPAVLLTTLRHVLRSGLPFSTRNGPQPLGETQMGDHHVLAPLLHRQHVDSDGVCLAAMAAEVEAYLAPTAAALATTPVATRQIVGLSLRGFALGKQTLTPAPNQIRVLLSLSIQGLLDAWPCGRACLPCSRRRAALRVRGA